MLKTVYPYEQCSAISNSYTFKHKVGIKNNFVHFKDDGYNHCSWSLMAESGSHFHVSISSLTDSSTLKVFLDLDGVFFGVQVSRMIVLIRGHHFHQVIQSLLDLCTKLLRVLQKSMERGRAGGEHHRNVHQFLTYIMSYYRVKYVILLFYSIYFYMD